jgi:hypothetical protein
MTRALVIGAGLAGLAAALDLAKARVSVTLAERRAFPGGRAYSFKDASGEIVDNGQHVFLECCTAYRTFLDEIGASDLVTLQSRAEVPFVDLRTGRTTVLCESWLPAPFHFLFSILGFKPLSWRDRRGILRAGRAMRKDAGSDAESLGTWLRARGQSDDAIRLFWDPSIVSVLNEHVDRVSSSQGIFVLRTAFFERKPAARVGVASVPLGEIADRAVAKIRAEGGTVEFNRKIDRMPDGPVISAVPAKALLELLGPQASHPLLRLAAAMETSPIVNLHFFFDAPVEAPPLVLRLRRRRLQGLHARELRHDLQSAARDLIDSQRELERDFLEEPKGHNRIAGPEAVRHRPRARGDVRGLARRRFASPAVRHAPPQPVPGRRVDRGPMAVHDGGRDSEREARRVGAHPPLSPR